MATTTATPELLQNNFGFLLTFTLQNADLSTATAFEVRIVKPLVDGERDTVIHNLNASAIIDPVKKIVGFTVAEGDLDIPGRYLIQLSDVTPGRRVSTKEQAFRVKATLERFEE